MTCGNLFKCTQCGAAMEKQEFLFIVFRNREKKNLQIYFTIIPVKKTNNTFKDNSKECIGTVWCLIIGNVGIQFSSHK